ncbi:MAG: hypothetical protein A2X94_16650 [Bdellovibrionales bacterium GWB1_55_8]|nr:MAG: hypothetical protein A2X94_16650 [Bdellovibrionales bacterium GWB1_55_8]
MRILGRVLGVWVGVAVSGAQAFSASGDVYRAGVLQVQEMKSKIMLSSSGGPHDRPNTGRNYIMARGCPGRILVFSSNGNEGKKTSNSTGSRAFVFLPCTSEPTLEKRADDRIVMKMGSGHEVVFSPVTGRIESISGATFEEKPVPTMKNEGGIRIKPTSGMIIDGGWLMGENPFSKMNRSSTLLGPKGASCAVSNSKFLQITGTKYDREYQFIGKGSNQVLKRNLKSACPKMNFYPWDLLEAQRSASPAQAASRVDAAK